MNRYKPSRKTIFDFKSQPPRAGHIRFSHGIRLDQKTYAPMVQYLSHHKELTTSSIVANASGTSKGIRINELSRVSALVTLIAAVAV